ncbi:MAG TPA: hypothetical protein VGG45_16215 [Terracidiphilus sp.]|jgi:hypothetical protein
MPAAPQADRVQDRVADRRTDRVSDRRTDRKLDRPHAGVLTNDGRFSIDKSRVPPGFVMEWKRHTLMGLRDVRNQVVTQQYHWKPVPHEMQPHFLGHLGDDPAQHIVVDGQGLYMRPAYLNEDAAVEQQENTLYQTNQQLQSLRLQSKDQVGGARTYIKRSVEAVPQAVE